MMNTVPTTPTQQVSEKLKQGAPMLQWFVIYTKARAEKKVADDIAKLGIEVYCPVRKVNQKWSDRTKVVEKPLFTSYVFVRLTDKDRHRVFEVQGVVRYLFWLNKPAVVRPEEISAIQYLLNDFDHNEIQLDTFAPRDLVTFQSGAFSGQQAEVIRQDGKKLRVYLPLLGIQLTVDMSANIVGK